MSLPENRNDSPYEEYKHNRHKINNLVGFGQIQKKNDWCPSNVCNVRLVVNREGITLCPECGRTVTKEQQQQKQEQKPLKLQQNEGPPKPIIISQKRKGKDKPKFNDVNAELSDEDLNDLRSMGYRI